MGIVQLQSRKIEKNAAFFPLFIGTRDKTVLQLIQMLLSVILMGVKCNQNTHRQKKSLIWTAFLISDLDFFSAQGMEKGKETIGSLIKNAPRCGNGTKTISNELHYMAWFWMENALNTTDHLIYLTPKKWTDSTAFNKEEHIDFFWVLRIYNVPGAVCKTRCIR